MFFIGFNRGFVKGRTQRGTLIATPDVREAQTFGTFDEAQSVMKQSNGYKHFAILEVPGSTRKLEVSNGQA